MCRRSFRYPKIEAQAEPSQLLRAIRDTPIGSRLAPNLPGMTPNIGHQPRPQTEPAQHWQPLSTPTKDLPPTYAPSHRQSNLLPITVAQTWSAPYLASRHERAQWGCITSPLMQGRPGKRGREKTVKTQEFATIESGGACFEKECKNRTRNIGKRSYEKRELCRVRWYPEGKPASPRPSARVLDPPGGEGTGKKSCSLQAAQQNRKSGTTAAGGRYPAA